MIPVALIFSCVAVGHALHVHVLGARLGLRHDTNWANVANAGNTRRDQRQDGAGRLRQLRARAGGSRGRASSGASALSYLIITGSLACAAALTNAGLRYMYAMGREGLLPRYLGKTHPRHKSPYMAVLTWGAVAVVLFLVFRVTEPHRPGRLLLALAAGRDLDRAGAGADRALGVHRTSGASTRASSRGRRPCARGWASPARSSCSRSSTTSRRIVAAGAALYVKELFTIGSGTFSVPVSWLGIIGLRRAAGLARIRLVRQGARPGEVRHSWVASSTSPPSTTRPPGRRQRAAPRQSRRRQTSVFGRLRQSPAACASLGRGTTARLRPAYSVHSAAWRSRPGAGGVPGPPEEGHMIVRRRLVPRALVAALAVFGLLVAVAPAMAGSPPSWTQVGDLRGSGCSGRGLAVRDVQGAARLRQSGRGLRQDRGHAPARAGSGAPHRRAVHQLRRAGRRRRRHHPGDRRRSCSARSTTTSTSSPSIRAASARARPSIDCKVNQETDGLYSTAVHHAREPRRQGARSPRTRPTSSAAWLSTRRSCPYVSTANVARDMDGIRAADGRQEAELLRLLVRHLPRRHLREPLPGQLPRDGARRPGRRQQLHQHAVGRPARAVGGLRARDRSLLHGLRRQSGVLQLRRRRSAGGVRRARRPGQPARDPGLGFRRPRRGQRRRPPRRARSYAMYAKQLWPDLAIALSAASHGDGTRHPQPGRLVLRQQRGRHVRSGHRPLLHDHGGRAELPAPRPDVPRRRRQRVGRVQLHVLVNTGYPEINYALWPIHAKDAFNGPFTRLEVGSDDPRDRHDV